MPSTDLETLQRSDHDALIRVEAKLDNLSTDVKVMGDGINTKVTDHELRIRKLEDVVTQTDPVNNLKLLHSLIQEFRDYKTTIKTILWAVGLLGGVVGSLGSILLPMLFRAIGWAQ